MASSRKRFHGLPESQATSETTLRPVPISPPSRPLSQVASVNCVTSINSATELQSKIEDAYKRMQEANRQFQQEPKGLCEELCDRVKHKFKKILLHKNTELANTPDNRISTSSTAPVAEEILDTAIRRRTFEVINLTNPKVQALTGDGRIPRKPSPLQQELNKELDEEKQVRRESILNVRDYVAFIDTDKLVFDHDETDELASNISEDETDTSHIEDLLSALSSEPAESIRMPFSVESDIQDRSILRNSPSPEPFQPRRVSRFFDSLRSSSRLSYVDSGSRTPVSLRGRSRAVVSPSPPRSESSDSPQQGPPSPYRLGRARRGGCANFHQLGG
ncbi:hypothetical protein LOZ53_004327 [Ophidiomyces ophidiicola]|nr:hypothetical protein LOZ55_002458 [Ophidiomyces ophidiicola]KAI1987458.1 hypothetical protein LOZ53_004327 [Ophidiomyces ophidiicola]KAI1988071.1 hypothetical protein LOZ51_005552 [Ophidiomyces ophidiicola]KAI1988342.1 hypothetical protein LOZ54_003237 [Ophidiomyces ophidiicola]